MPYAVCGAGGFAISDDMSSWNITTVPDSPIFWDVIRGPDRFVFLGTYKTIVVPDDGPTVVVSDTVEYPFRGCYAQGYYWRVTNLQTRIDRSSDGITWTPVIRFELSAPTLSISGNSHAIIVTCANGATLVTTDAFASHQLSAVGESTISVWLSGVNGSRVFRSQQYDWIEYCDPPYDALSFNNPATRIPASPQGATGAVDMAFSSECGVCPGLNGTYNRTLDNGETWLPGVTEPTAQYVKRGIVFGETKFVGVHDSGRIYTIDSDGLNPTIITSLPFALYGVDYGVDYGVPLNRSRYVVVPGSTWTKQRSYIGTPGVGFKRSPLSSGFNT